jgi:GNAT superfamily N-acetyltransferase
VIPWTIRPAGPADTDAAGDVWLSSRRDAIGKIPAPIHSEPEVREWIAQVVVATMECWIAEASGGETAGLLVLDNGWIEQLYVRAKWQRQGLGSALIAHAKQREAGPLQLWTFVSNEGAQRFYERHGFIEVERTNGEHNDERAPDIRYRWTPE